MVDVLAKGKRGEREVARIINAVLKSDYRRTPNSGGLHVPADIVNAGDAGPLDVYHIEIKNHKRLQIPKWMKQVHKDIEPDKRPMLVFKMNAVWYAMTKLEDILKEISE